MESNDILTRLAREIPDYSKRQKSLAQYIYDNCDKAAFLTADMLAEAAGVSESSVVRFARQLGYGGYSDMRKALQQVLRVRLTGIDAVNDSGTLEWLRASVASESKCVQSILCDQNERCFEPAVQALIKARVIYIQGMGALLGIALHMSMLLKAMGLRVLSLQGQETATDTFDLDAEDVYVSLSSSLYSGRLSTLHYAKDRGATTLLICDDELTAGNKYADYRLYAKGDTGMLSIIRAIAMAVQRDSGVSIEDSMREIENKRREYLAYEYAEN